MRKNISTIILLVLIGHSLWTDYIAITGGFRSGLAFGIETTKKFNNRLSGRFGIEEVTGEDLSLLKENPFIMFAEGEAFLFEINKSPLSIAAGVVGTYGPQTKYGGSLSIIIDKIYGQEPLFFETGLDYISSASLRLKLGYKIL